WNYVHNLMYSIANLLEQGRFDEATRLSARIAGARGKLETTLYINAARDSISRLDPRLPVALRTADFPQVLQLVNASTVLPDRATLEFLLARLANVGFGDQVGAANKIAEAERVSTHLDAELWRMAQHHNDSARMQGMSPPQPSQSGPPKLAVMPDALLDPVL